MFKKSDFVYATLTMKNLSLQKLSLILFLLLFFNQAFFSKALAQNKSILIIGDSISEGLGVAKTSSYPDLLQKKLEQQKKLDWKIINSSVSGSTSASAVGRLKWAIKSKPSILILALGANDGLRGFEPKLIKENLKQAIVMAKNEKIKVVLAGMQMPPNYGSDYTKKFKQVFYELAKEENVKLIPFLLDKVGGQVEMNQSDGIHPNENGHKVIADTVWKTIKELL